VTITAPALPPPDELGAAAVADAINWYLAEEAGLWEKYRKATAGARAEHDAEVSAEHSRHRSRLAGTWTRYLAATAGARAAYTHAVAPLRARYSAITALIEREDTQWPSR
jgi:hypothetical protein